MTTRPQSWRQAMKPPTAGPPFQGPGADPEGGSTGSPSGDDVVGRLLGSPSPEVSLFEPHRQAQPRPNPDPVSPWPARRRDETPSADAGRDWPTFLGFPLAVIGLGVLLGVICVLVLVAAGVQAPWQPEEPRRVVPAAGLPAPDRIDIVETVMPTPIGSAAAEPTPVREAVLGDGTFIVGADLEPGRYRSSVHTTACRWARLDRSATAEGEPGPVLARGTGQGGAAVTVRPTDGAFRTAGCGTWARVD